MGSAKQNGTVADGKSPMRPLLRTQGSFGRSDGNAASSAAVQQQQQQQQQPLSVSTGQHQQHGNIMLMVRDRVDYSMSRAAGLRYWAVLFVFVAGIVSLYAVVSNSEFDVEHLHSDAGTHVDHTVDESDQDEHVGEQAAPQLTKRRRRKRTVAEANSASVDAAIGVSDGQTVDSSAEKSDDEVVNEKEGELLQKLSKKADERRDRRMRRKKETLPTVEEMTKEVKLDEPAVEEGTDRESPPPEDLSNAEDEHGTKKDWSAARKLSVKEDLHVQRVEVADETVRFVRKSGRKKEQRGSNEKGTCSPPADSDCRANERQEEQFTITRYLEEEEEEARQQRPIRTIRRTGKRPVENNKRKAVTQSVDEQENEQPELVEQKQQRKTRHKYRKNDITCREDNKIRDALDAADHLLERVRQVQGEAEKAADYAAALAEFEVLLLRQADSPRAHYGKARALDNLSERKPSNQLLEQAIQEYEATTNCPNVPDDLFRLAAGRLVDRANFRGA